MDGSECEDNLFVSTQHIIIIIGDANIFLNIMIILSVLISLFISLGLFVSSCVFVVVGWFVCCFLSTLISEMLAFFVSP